MEKKDFLETCVVLCGLDKESILKTILREKYLSSNRVQPPDNPVQALPAGCDLLVYDPSPENFAEFAYDLCSLKETKEEITRYLLSIRFDASVQAAMRPRVRTRQSRSLSMHPPWKKTKTNDDNSDSSNSEDNVSVTHAAEVLCNISMDTTKLPSKLNLFVNNDGKVMNTMSEILPNFFGGVEQVWPGIYRKDNLFVLLVVDNGRYKNNWKSSGTQNKLSWFTSPEDTDKAMMDRVLDPGAVIHVVRKRKGEMRYMGKCVKIEDVDKEIGSCVMYVA